MGNSWTPHLIYTGDEHHDGAQMVDIDSDGDLDVISIGWDNQRVTLYENLAVSPTTTPISSQPFPAIEARNNIPATFMLHQNFPNPFNGSTTIRYDLPEVVHVTLSIYNILGQEVATIVDGLHQAGNHETQLRTDNLASGMYFYRLTAGSFVSTRKLLLLR